MTTFYSLFLEFPELETERFILRQVNVKDINDLYELYSDASSLQYQQSEAMTNIDQAKKTVIAFLNGYASKKFIRWCIADKNSDKIVGVIALHSFDLINSKAEIGYMLNSNYLMHNIMTECAKVILNFAFNQAGFSKIEASIHPDNLRSINLVQKLGFKKELLLKNISFNFKTGIFEDRVIFGLYKAVPLGS
ncbi:GNAT family N-acetyltransferase [Clostridium manihotivorum]|uniref:GNAT family N-acetyltransferase n=1 Tax=Clostridium manihotivorum TaxID=2320868 RepID=A0A3R5QTK4_9CLOT|nr:GNAT family N-acetyltransferase [Clostridium manihotivorum]QAA31993.1 GNAT family N-acetyltransferase [Clostridium manihotivorum]